MDGLREGINENGGEDGGRGKKRACDLIYISKLVNATHVCMYVCKCMYVCMQ